MNSIYCLLLLLCPYLSRANKQNTVPLTIGDKLPGIQLTQLVNSSRSTTNTASYRGKLLILDFMSTACSGCLKTLPLLGSLQKQYAAQMQVLLVSSQSTAAVKRFLQNTAIGRQLKLPIVTADNVLKGYFPHEYISHLVWINAAGTVVAITGSEYCTASNIAQALQNQPLNWPVKNDIAGTNLAPPFLQLNNQVLPAAATPAAGYYNAFYKHMPGLAQGMYTFADTANGTLKTLLVNQPIPEMYRRLYNQNRLPLSHTLLRVQQPAFFVYSSEFYRVGWDRYNSFCYEAVQPASMPAPQRLAQMLASVNSYTQTRAYFTDTVVAGFILKDTATASRPLLFTRPAISNAVLSTSGLLYSLNNRYGAPPVTDGRSNPHQAWLTGWEPADFTDIPALNRQLLAYGLVLLPQPQQIHALVIAQTGSYPFTHSPKLYAK